jgi:hypothetical protein
MMFLLRSAAPSAPTAVDVKVARRTPAIVSNGAGKTDYFCIGEPEDIAALRTEGWEVLELRDGWYADDHGGGIAISGHGKYWEVRDTPFTIKESVGAAASSKPSSDMASDEHVNVRGAIFGV